MDVFVDGKLVKMIRIVVGVSNRSGLVSFRAQASSSEHETRHSGTVVSFPRAWPAPLVM
jgi:hypothetical protein